MYIEPWSDINEYPEGHREALAFELEKELAQNHILYGLSSKVLAKREDQDEILVSNDLGYFTIHLTWSGNAEISPFPNSEQFETLEMLKIKLASDSEFY